MSLEKAIQKLAKAVQASALNVDPDGETVPPITLPPVVLNVRCQTKGLRLEKGGPMKQYCLCRSGGYRNGCVIKMTEGPCDRNDQNQQQYQIRIPPESYPDCIDLKRV